MPLNASLTPLPSPSGRSTVRGERATSLTRALAALLLLAASTGCDRDSGAAAGSGDTPAPGQEPWPAADPEAVAAIEALRATFAPISPTATSDKRAAWQDAKQRHLEELHRGPPSLAAAALEIFVREGGTDEWRAALLSVAAHTDRELARPLLEKLTLQYGSGASLGLRGEAMRLFARTSPGVAAEVLEPIVLDPRPNATYPPKEQMLREWAVAAREVRKPVDATLARIAVDLGQLPDTRYVAVEELGAERGSKAGFQALRTVLVESSSDGLLRRKAAQALRTSLPREDFCKEIERVAERESDESFLLFLADMLGKNCP